MLTFLSAVVRFAIIIVHRGSDIQPARTANPVTTGPPPQALLLETENGGRMYGLVVRARDESLCLIWEWKGCFPTSGVAYALGIGPAG